MPPKKLTHNIIFQGTHRFVSNVEVERVRNYGARAFHELLKLRPDEPKLLNLLVPRAQLELETLSLIALFSEAIRF